MNQELQCCYSAVVMELIASQTDVVYDLWMMFSAEHILNVEVIKSL